MASSCAGVTPTITKKEHYSVRELKSNIIDPEIINRTNLDGSGFLTISVEDCNDKPVPVIVQYREKGLKNPYGKFYATDEEGFENGIFLRGKYSVMIHRITNKCFKPHIEILRGRDFNYTKPLAEYIVKIESEKQVDLEFKLCD